MYCDRTGSDEALTAVKVELLIKNNPVKLINKKLVIMLSKWQY